jgi:hypothetical protein
MNVRNLIFALLLTTPLATLAATPAMVSNGMLTDSGGMTCRRRLNTDPPCRLKIDPGAVAAF